MICIKGVFVMSEISVQTVNYNMAEWGRMAFIEDNPKIVGEFALGHYAEIVPQDEQIEVIASMLDEADLHE